MSEHVLDLGGLKCPLPALKTRKALRGLQPGDILAVSCTDPLARLDLPNLARETGDRIVETSESGGVVTFRFEKV